MQPEIISAAIRSMAETGVDYVKVGLFDESGLIQCIQQLEPTIRSLKKPVIAVIFADQLPQQKLIPLLAKSGFAGVMLDTARKDGQGLLNHLSVEALQQFVVEAKSAGLLCGLAGALRIEDIETLSPLQPDYLGFRSALCQQHRRTNLLDPELAKQIQTQLNVALPEVLAC
uniref:(5-formylfuran-3-yl)methyl phosphate synthase n=2 Tax=Methylophaga nitratireducenticrescens TaxID=754476 RepID=I1XFK9_METNJ